MSATRPTWLPGRRRFLRALGLASLTGTLGVPRLFAQTGGGGGGDAAEKPAAPGASKPPAEEAEPPISDEARALADIVRQRYGKYLTPEQLQGVTRELQGRVQGGKLLRATVLKDADEPDFTFHA